MKTAVVNLLSLFVLSQSHAQQSSSHESPDTTVITHFSISGPEFSIAIPTILLSDAPRYDLGITDTSSTGLRTALLLQHLRSPLALDETPFIMSTLNFQSKNSDGPSKVRVVLGAV
jgi:hypothetical protein